MAKGQEFRFKQFKVQQDRCAMKVGTDGVLLGALATGGRRILDIGTGTGLVALMMAQRFPESRLTAIDIDGDACSQATQNAAGSPFGDRVTVQHTALADFAADSSGCGAYDAIVCNPPFFENSLECPDDRRTAARHTSSLPFAELAANAARLLSDGGTMTVIVPTDAVTRMEAECAYCSLCIARRLHIKTVERKSPKRTLLYIMKLSSGSQNVGVGEAIEDNSVETQCLMENGQRSEWYSTVCRDFYL